MVSDITRVMLSLIFFPLFTLPTSAQVVENADHTIETLDVIHVSGTAVTPASRILNFRSPTIQLQDKWMATTMRLAPKFKLSKPLPRHRRILLDQTSQRANLFTPAKPVVTTRPPYPRQARERNWHGRVIVRLNIGINGKVDSASVEESSGHQLLDTSALQTAKHWMFQPAKNGSFPVISTVKIPIHFSLVK